jgi:hypothetical protein
MGEQEDMETIDGGQENRWIEAKHYGDGGQVEEGTGQSDIPCVALPESIAPIHIKDLLLVGSPARPSL